MSSLPFTLSGVYADLAHVRGVARLEVDDLVLEFRMMDSLIGVLQSELKETRIPLGEIEAVEFKKKFFSGVLTIRVRSMRSLESVPGADQCELNLVCKRQHRNLAQQTVTTLTVRLAERMLEQ